MGLIQNGKWVDQWYDTKESGGEFRRQDSRFRSWLTTDGQPVTDSETSRKIPSFKAEKGRYHLYVSLACPWAHRTLIFRELKGLQDYIDVTIVDPIMLENGWEVTDPLYGFDFMYQLYLKADSQYEGRVTVPVLWDKQTEQIISNESSEIIRMFNSAFDTITGNELDFWPAAKRNAIEIINEDIYQHINNGVYRAGFATKASAYEEAVTGLFDALDRIEARLGASRYLIGDDITEADWRLFTTLVRFDLVYVGHFKCNLRRIADYPALSGYLRELYQMPGIAETVVMPHIKTHYYASHRNLNPTGIVPKGPILDFLAPHGRQR